MLSKKIQFNIVGKVILVLIIIFALFYYSRNIYALSSNFTVSPEIPENQVDKNLGYFNLVMSPEDQQDLSFKLNNSSSKSITIEMAFARSTTNGNGLAIYDSSKAAKDSSLKYNIEDFVNIPKKEITIAAHAQATLAAKVSMPKGMAIPLGMLTFAARVACACAAIVISFLGILTKSSILYFRELSFAALDES